MVRVTNLRSFYAHLDWLTALGLLPSDILIDLSDRWPLEFQVTLHYIPH